MAIRFRLSPIHNHVLFLGLLAAASLLLLLSYTSSHSHSSMFCFGGCLGLIQIIQGALVYNHFLPCIGKPHHASSELLCPGRAFGRNFFDNRRTLLRDLDLFISFML